MHYTGIGTEIREDFSINQTKVVVNMPEGFGCYGVEDAAQPNYDCVTGDKLAGYIPNTKFEWYLKNHLGSTMLVYGTEGNATSDPFRVSAPLAAYDYRAFGEMVELTPAPTGKVTENFTGKEHDDEIALNYFGARYLDPMLGMWISVDPKRLFASPYLYAGNEYNPIIGSDSDGNWFNPLGLLVGVFVGVSESWNAQAEYRRVSGENYSPWKETLVGVTVYGAYVAGGALGIGGNVLKAGFLAGLIGGSISGGSVALAQGLGGGLNSIDGDMVAQSFTKGAVSSMMGALVGTAATEMMGGNMSGIYGIPNFQEVLGGAIGGAAGFVIDQKSTLEWDNKCPAEK